MYRVYFEGKVKGYFGLIWGNEKLKFLVLMENFDGIDVVRKSFKGLGGYEYFDRSLFLLNIIVWCRVILKKVIELM